MPAQIYCSVCYSLPYRELPEEWVGGPKAYRNLISCRAALDKVFTYGAASLNILLYKELTSLTSEYKEDTT